MSEVTIIETPEPDTPPENVAATVTETVADGIVTIAEQQVAIATQEAAIVIQDAEAAIEEVTEHIENQERSLDALWQRTELLASTTLQNMQDMKEEILATVEALLTPPVSAEEVIPEPPMTEPSTLSDTLVETSLTPMEHTDANEPSAVAVAVVEPQGRQSRFRRL